MAIGFSHLHNALGGPSPGIRTALQSDRVRLVINALHAKSGGGITYLRNILPVMAEDDRLEIHLFLHRDQMKLLHPVDERVIVHLFEFPRGLVSLMLWEQFILPVMLKVMSADVLFSPANFGCLFVRNQAILLRNALAVAKTETRASKRLYWAMLGLITLMSLTRVRRAIAVSGYAAKSLSLFLWPLMKSKTTVIHHGIDSIFQPADVPREDYLLAVSDIYVQKNLHNLFRAMRRVCDRHPDIRLLVAGQKVDEWYYDKAVELANELGISDNIQFLGRLSPTDLRNHYQRCRLFVFPSTAETFGFPLVEAMACGAPVVSSNLTAMPEIVGDAALTFDPLDTDDIAQAILQVIDDAELRQSLSERGLKRSKDFSWIETAKRTADVLVETAGPKARGHAS